MVLLCLAQQILAQSFLGGSGQDLARYYLLASKRSVVCSERVVKGFGPNRFMINDIDHLVYPTGTFFKVIHNTALNDLGPDDKQSANQRRFPIVDCLASTFLPLYVAGLTGIDSETQQKEMTTNPSTLSLTTASPFTKALVGKGSDSIENLVNAGLSKPIIFPKLLGKMWFSCSMVQVSELDFVNAVAQVADCKLVNKPESYTFVPDAEKLRGRLMNAYKLFGDPNDTYEGLKQRVIYRAFELASSDTIVGCVSDTKYSQTIPIPDDKELRADIANLVNAAIAKFSKNENPTVRALAENVKPDGELMIGYKYAFSSYVVVPLKNGTVWYI